MTARHVYAERQKLANIAADCWGFPVSSRARTLAHLRLLDGYLKEAGFTVADEDALYAQLKPLFSDVAARRTCWSNIEWEVVNIACNSVYEPYREAIQREFNAVMHASPDKTIKQVLDQLVGGELADFRLRNPGMSAGDEVALLCRYSPRYDMVIQLITELAGGISHCCESWWPAADPLWFDDLSVCGEG